MADTYRDRANWTNNNDDDQYSKISLAVPNLSAQLRDDCQDGPTTAETIVREKIKTKMCQKAVSFKEEIIKEMNNLNAKIRKDVVQMTSETNYLWQEQESKNVALKQHYFEKVEEIEGVQKEFIINAHRMLPKVSEYRIEFENLIQKWENFRTNFSAATVKAIRTEMEKKERDNRKPESFLDWHYFMPEILTDDLNHGTTTVRVKYFE